MKLSDVNKKMNSMAPINQADKSNFTDRTQFSKEVKKQIFLADKIKPSAQSRDIKKIRAILDMTPEVQSGRVTALKKAIDGGYYQIKAEAIADKMLKESIFEMSRGYIFPRPKKAISRR